ncbi:MAG: heme-binding protein [Candidatus Colwellbacteria bacterium]|nr:heme-binding protein [Candidatus Colwellbacteria bacterium]
MLLAFRTLKSEDKGIIDAFLKEQLKDERGGIAYALVNNEGEVLAAGTVLDCDERYMSTARSRAIMAVGIGKNTSDMRTNKTGDEFVDGMFSPGGVLIAANEVIYGAIGVAGRPQPDKFIPFGRLNDNDLALMSAEDLKRKLLLEETIE